MSESQSNPVLRLLPSMTDVAFLMPLLLFFAMGDGIGWLMADGDTGWHVRTGQWILQHGGVPARDLFSFTRPGRPWFAWEWLWDVLAALLYGAGGMAAVALASLLVICLGSVLLFRLTRRRCGNSLLAILMVVVATGGSAVHWLARPHLMTSLFTVVFYTLLERARQDGTLEGGRLVRRLVWLPLLTVLWTNMHGGFLMGVLLVSAYAAGDALTGLLSAEGAERRAAFRRSAGYLGVAAGCLAASIVNPYGWRLHAHILEFVGNANVRHSIAEWMPLNLALPSARFFEVLWLLAGGAALWGLGRRRYTDVILLLAWAQMALASARNVPLFMLVAVPIVAQALGEWLAVLPDAPVAAWLRRLAASVRDTSRDLTETDCVGRWHVTSAAALLAVALPCWAPAPPRPFRADFDPRHFPAGAVRELGREATSRRIFTSDQWGDYLIYRLYPQGRVYVDGRSDFYGDQFMRSYIDIMDVNYDWERLLSRDGVDTVLLPTQAPLAGALKESRRWRAVYDDGVAIVFRAASSDQRTGASLSAAVKGRGTDRDRAITKPATRDLTVTHANPTT